VIVLAPESVFECYTLTVEAFNLAERFRAPVFLASQKEVGLTREPIDMDLARRAAPEVLPRLAAPEEGRYIPHAFDALDDVAAMSPIGGAHLVRYTTSTHDQKGLLTKDPEVIARMLEHYERKITDHADEIARYELEVEVEAETLVVAYGVTARAAREAVAMARGRGARVSLLVLKTLYPVPERVLVEAMAPVRRVVCPEMNLGQYVEELRKLDGDRELISVNKMNTDLLAPEEILSKGGLA
jgi:2-oxoglutarate ferredoxin oxidoreductase subunit alpha